MFLFSAESYGSTISDLVRDRPLLPLANPPRNEPMVAHLALLTPEDLFLDQEIADPLMAGACLAGLWLAHGCLDESHKISQKLDTPTGSYWHGLVHRLEPDFANSKYWFRRVGRHPIFDALRVAAASLPDASAPGFLRTQAAWDPCAFVGLCQACVEFGSPGEQACRSIQRCEWEMLFAYCYRATTS